MGERTPISIVIPCFNEAKVIGYLRNTLKLLRGTLGRAYDMEFILVDDCSTDETWAKMNETFGDQPGFRLLRHEVNQGVAYLDDGTMVVIDNARKFIGKHVEVHVTSVLQTTAGRMIFTQLREPDRSEVQAMTSGGG